MWKAKQAPSISFYFWKSKSVVWNEDLLSIKGKFFHLCKCQYMVLTQQDKVNSSAAAFVTETIKVPCYPLFITLAFAPNRTVNRAKE